MKVLIASAFGKQIGGFGHPVGNAVYLMQEDDGRGLLSGGSREISAERTAAIGGGYANRLSGHFTVSCCRFR